MTSEPEVTDTAPEPVVQREPAAGIPAVIDTPAGFATLCETLAAGSGPLAVDTERAHGFRYFPRAYLLQFRRAGAGTALVDPIALSPAPPADLSALTRALGDTEWVLHAASQDLACLVELGLVPPRVFDTEVAARLLGYPRVSLGTLVEETLGVRLLKEHSAADWSTRPLPREWLAYAALDVEFLLELRDVLATELREAGKDSWADQEFAATLAASLEPATPRVDPWRRTSGLHVVRTPLGLAIVRELWQTRDDLAQRLDRSPGRLLPDAAMCELAASVHAGPLNASRDALRAIPLFQRRGPKRYEANWLAALERVESMSRHQYPPLHVASGGPPPPRTWAHRDPAAAARWEAVRPAVVALAEDLRLPVENLISPEHLRRVLWTPPAPPTPEAIDAALAEAGARPWQRELVVDLIASALDGLPS